MPSSLGLRTPFLAGLFISALAHLGLAGCSNSPHPSSLSCLRGDQCPSGYACVGVQGTTPGICKKATDGGGIEDKPGPDASPGPDEAVPPVDGNIDGTSVKPPAIDGPTDGVTAPPIDAAPDWPSTAMDGPSLDGLSLDLPLLRPDGLGSDVPMTGTGGNGGTGGTGAGGAIGSGGATGAGGLTGTGGVTGTGGAMGTGGAPGTGGASGTGGVSATGGTSGTGGATSADACAGLGDFTPCTVVTTPDRKYDICVAGVCVSPGCGDASCNVPGPHFPLADTDQRLCSNNSAQITCSDSGQAFFGQDAQYGWDMLHAESERFTRDLTVADQPMVQDNVTGLSWQNCVAGLTGNACNSGSAVKQTWQNALSYCDGLDWGGHQDWRLPDTYELQSIVDFGASPRTIDTTAFPATPSNSWFWSSSSNAGNPSGAWEVDFSSGSEDGLAKSNTFYVRCVRSGPVSWAQTPRFSHNTPVTEQPVVVDNVTGLVWQGCAAGLTSSACTAGTGATYAWENALGYCAGLTWGGLQDWRLPNAKELRSIVNERRTSKPGVDVTAFPNTQADDFWSSSSEAGWPGYAWSVGFYYGYVYPYGKSSSKYVRCVRNGP